MARKVYRSAQGKGIDLGALQLQNETVRAVGNMGVNARGDVINPQNATVDSRNQSVKRHYKKQTRSNVSDDVVLDSKKAVKQKPAPQPQKVDELVLDEPMAVEPVVTKTAPEPVVETKTSGGGLADAIAKAKQVKQEPMKTPRQLRQEASGVKKI